MSLKTELFLAVIIGAVAVASAGVLLPSPKPVPKRTCDAPIGEPEKAEVIFGTKPGRCSIPPLGLQCILCMDLCKSNEDCLSRQFKMLPSAELWKYVCQSGQKRESYSRKSGTSEERRSRSRPG